MKLKKKLILSCAALAACATTLVSSTFAWYTSNTKVTADGVNGTSAASGSALLLISQDALNWDTAIDQVAFSKDDELMPMQYVNDAEAGTHIISASKTGTTDAESNYVEFTLYIKNASTTEGTLVMTINDLENTATLNATPIIGGNYALVGGTQSDTTYTTNMLRVLSVEIEKTIISAGEEGETESVGYSLAPLVDTFGDTLAEADSYSATEYYEAVMGEELPANGSTALVDFTDDGVEYTDLPTAGTVETADSYMQLTFKVFIDGWNEACFDACQGQNFSFNLEFNFVETE